MLPVVGGVPKAYAYTPVAVKKAQPPFGWGFVRLLLGCRTKTGPSFSDQDPGGLKSCQIKQYFKKNLFFPVSALLFVKPALEKINFF